jgi:SAM-dependent methyltransferase
MARNIAPNKDVAHPFDIEHGTDTGGYLSPQEITTGHAHDLFGYGYSAIAPSVFREMCRRWRDTLAAPVRGVAAYSFVDVGAGKGRALLLACALPFRKVIGVELNPELAGIARNNVAHWNQAARPRAKVRVLLGDVLEVRWSRAPLLVYLYNPFACELIERLVERLESVERPGSAPIDLLYVNPTCADVLSRRGGWVLQWTDRIEMDTADQAADPYGTTFDRVSCYRYHPRG